MYEADRLDVLNLWALPTPEMDHVRQLHAGEYVSAPDLQTTYIGFDVSRPPFDDPWVRRAFVLAVDRETLADVALGGYDFPATGGFIPPGMPGHSPGIGLPYDPSHAQQLLADAGYPGGRGFPDVDALTGRDYRGLEFVQAQWRENLGVEITWERTDWATFLDRLAEIPPHLYDIAWVADYPDPDNFLRVSPIRRQTRWENEAFDRLVEEARRVTDQGERMRLCGRADRILVEEAPIIPLNYCRSHLLVKPWVSKYPASKTPAWRFEHVVIEPH
jgi:oligopeptide transport system substrate-binding protein